MPSKVAIDFETRSQANLKQIGAYLYARHTSTEILCLAYGFEGSPVKLWHPGLPPPDDLLRHVVRGGLVEAHNSFFERAIWYYKTPWDWPPIDPSQWRCSAAKAAACAIPRDLESACLVMGVAEKKDAAGKRHMQRLSKSRGPIDPDDLERLYEYCRQDVRAEHALSAALPDLSPDELSLWQLDQEINWRGVRVDRSLAEAALWITERAKAAANRQFHALTGIPKGTQRKKVMAWLEENEGLVFTSTGEKELIQQLRGQDVTPRAQRVLDLMRTVNRTSTAKYADILRRSDPDDHRVRDSILFHGAATGRWSGKGIQPQNFPRPPKGVDLSKACAEVVRDPDMTLLTRADPITWLSKLLRGVFVPTPGRKLCVGDYSSIEARVLLWLADDTTALGTFRSGGDIYLDMASTIFRRRITKADEDERFLGKVCVLGLGYQMAGITFLVTLRTVYGVRFKPEECRRIMGAAAVDYEGWARDHFNPGPDETPEQKMISAKDTKRLRDIGENPQEILHELALTKYLVDVYRSRYENVPALWRELNAVALRVVQTGDPETAANGRIRYYMEPKFLCCRLPSGRVLRYFGAEPREVVDQWGRVGVSIRYWREGLGRQWVSTFTYGGKLVENVVQAIARDVMAAAMRNMDSKLLKICATVHDEIMLESEHGNGFKEAMAYKPLWAAGIPLDADVRIGDRYSK